MSDLISAGQAMHRARLAQKEAEERLALAKAKVDAIMQRSKTGVAAQMQFDTYYEERAVANKNVKSQETRFKNLALAEAEARLRENANRPEDGRVAFDYALKDFHYGVTATPITVYEVPAEGDGLITFVAYLVSKGMGSIVQFDDKELTKFLKDTLENSGELPEMVTVKPSARLTIAGVDKWDVAERNVEPSDVDIDAITEFLAD